MADVPGGSAKISSSGSVPSTSYDLCVPDVTLYYVKLSVGLTPPYDVYEFTIAGSLNEYGAYDPGEAGFFIGDIGDGYEFSLTWEPSNPQWKGMHSNWGVGYDPDDPPRCDPQGDGYVNILNLWRAEISDSPFP